jgi:hypothetical protein
MGHFVGPEYVDVHQRSLALGSKLGSNQPSAISCYPWTPSTEQVTQSHSISPVGVNLGVSDAFEAKLRMQAYRHILVTTLGEVKCSNVHSEISV